MNVKSNTGSCGKQQIPWLLWSDTLKKLSFTKFYEEKPFDKFRNTFFIYMELGGFSSTKGFCLPFLLPMLPGRSQDLWLFTHLLTASQAGTGAKGRLHVDFNRI